MEPIKPGIYPGVPFADYLGWDAVSQSTLKDYRKSALHARWEATHPADSQELIRGHAAHIAILEPDRFAAEFAVAPKIDRRTAAGKAAWAAFEGENEGKIILTEQEHELCQAWRMACLEHPIAKGIMDAKGPTELSVVWQDPDVGVLCKGRMDRVVTFAGWTMIVDLKTTGVSPSHQTWPREIHKWGYHVQAAFYVDGLDAHAKRNRQFAWITVEKNPPHDVVVFTAEEGLIEQGRREYKRLLARHKKALETNVYPGYSHKLETVGLPSWALDSTIEGD